MSYCKISKQVTHAAYEPNMYIVICIIVFITVCNALVSKRLLMVIMDWKCAFL